MTGFVAVRKEGGDSRVKWVTTGLAVVFLLTTLFLPACENKELKQENEALKKQIESLNREKSQLESQLKESTAKSSELTAKVEELTRVNEDLKAKADDLAKANEALKARLEKKAPAQKKGSTKTTNKQKERREKR